MEQTIIPYSSCNLSAINLSKLVVNGEFDWKGLFDVTSNVMDLMNNVIDVMDFPDPRFTDNVKKYRPVGIGMMGLADALCMLNFRYDGPEGKKFAGDVMKVMTAACVDRSAELAKDYGSFYEYHLHKDNMIHIIEQHISGIDSIFGDGFEKMIMDKVLLYGVRNCQFTTCAPTGTTALSCDASYGMEPLFGLVFQKNYIDGRVAMICNPVFDEKCLSKGWYNPEYSKKIAENNGSLKGVRGIPKEVREIFVTAHDIKYRDRIDMQAEIQKGCSTAISSTINLSKDTTVDDIDNIYRYAYQKGLKGVTVYIDGSKKNQPVTSSKSIVTAEYKRPSKLNSKTFRVETGEGVMYATVCDYEGKPLEVFIHLGKSGQKLNAFSEALGRVISIALQKGVPVKDIIDTMFRINSDKQTWFRFEETDKRPIEILSIPDAIAKLLDRYYGDEVYEGEMFEELCLKCGTPMMNIEGCLTCTCGYSKCA